MIPEANESRRNLVFDHHQIPIGRVKTYDTKFTVPSKGIVYRIYDLGYAPGVSPQLADPYYETQENDFVPVLNGTTEDGGRIGVVFDDWETGVAPAVGSDYFATVYEGYFYARETGTYNLKFDYYGALQVYFDTDPTHSFINGSGRSANDIEGLTPLHDDWVKTGGDDEVVHTAPDPVEVAMDAGTFYKFRIKYWNKLRGHSAVVVSFATPSGDGTNYVPFSAGSCSDYYYKADDNDYFIEPTDVLSVVSMNGQRRETDSAAYSFTARITDTESQNAYNSDVDTFGTIKKDMLVKFQIGYSTSEYGYAATNSDFVTRFTGFITSDVTLYRDKYGANAVFTCHDFKTRLISTPNLNYPNTVSYLYNSYYNTEVDKDPDGFNKVRFFDRWPLEKAVKTLLILGGIDPQLLDQKIRAVDVDGVVVDTTLDTIHVQDIKLESHDNYAKWSPNFSWPNDYKPLWSFKFATQNVNDIINELSKNYGFRFSFSTEGLPNITSVDFYEFVDLPTSYNESDLRYNDGAINFQYLKIAPGTTKYYEFTGAKADILIQRSSLAGGFSVYSQSYVDGAWTALSQITTLEIDGELVNKPAGVFNAYMTRIWNPRDGMYGPVSSNPCVIRVPQRIAYGLHRYAIKAVGEDLYVDGLKTFVVDSHYPVRNYTTANHIKDLSIIDNIKDMVNEVLVVGGESGPSIGGTEDTAAHIPTEHIFFRAIDVRSQLDPGYKYYRGRKIPVIIKEPKITQQDRAQWLAEYTLERYRTNALLATFAGAGDPFLEVFDPITVSDLKTGFITPDKVLWVVGFSEQMSKGQYTVSGVETTPRPPIPSFIKDTSIPDFILDNYPNKFVAFEDFIYTGSHTATESEGEYGSDPYGTAPFGGQDFNYHGYDFSKRVHFNPYDARENNDLMYFRWTLLKRGRQYLEVWDSRGGTDDYKDPYAQAAGSGHNADAVAADFAPGGYVANQSQLLAVLYLNTEGVPDEPGNYSVTWDTVYEAMSKADPKWNTQTRYYQDPGADLYDPEVHGDGDLHGPSGAGLFSTPYYDTTGLALDQEDWPHRSRKNTAFYPLKIRHYFVGENGEEAEYWWGTQVLNPAASDFTNSYPYYIHTLTIPGRFDVDFDFVRVKERSAGSGTYEVLEDYFIDNWWTKAALSDPDDIASGKTYSHSHPEYPTSTRYYLLSPNYQNNSKLVNATAEEDHKFGVYLTCSRPNQRLQVIDALMGYTSTQIAKLKVYKRPLETTGEPYPTYAGTGFETPTEYRDEWFMAWDWSGDLRLVSENKHSANSEIDQGVVDRAFDIMKAGGNNPFSDAYSFRRFDSTYNLTSPLSDLRNVFVIDLDVESDFHIPLFKGMSKRGNPPLDSRYMFHPSWQGGILSDDPVLYKDAWFSPKADRIIMPFVPIVNVGEKLHWNDQRDEHKRVLQAYQDRKSEGGWGGSYVTPKSWTETIYNVCTQTSPLAEGDLDDSDSGLYDNPDYFVDLYSDFYTENQEPGNSISETLHRYLYTAFNPDPSTSDNELYNSYRLVLYMHVVDEGGRVYRVVMDDALSMGAGTPDTAELEHSYSNINPHKPNQSDLPVENPTNPYYADQYYDKFPTAILGRATLTGNLATSDVCRICYQIPSFTGATYISTYTKSSENEDWVANQHGYYSNISQALHHTYWLYPSSPQGVDWEYHQSVSAYVAKYQYDMLSRGDLYRSLMTGNEYWRSYVHTALSSERFFPVHSLAAGVDLRDMDIDFQEYHRRD